MANSKYLIFKIKNFDRRVLVSYIYVLAVILTMSKKIFISYSDQDRSRMRSLERIINKSRHFTSVIIADRREALVALTDKVKSGIFESDYIVPIITETSISSQWLNQEIGFASALNKEIIPIVEHQIINQLKGFIHKNIDLPYNFSEKVNAKATRGVYRKICELLVTDLLIKNNFTPKSLELENIFPGQWKSSFSAPHITGTESLIEIKEGNKYFAQGKHWFNIENLKLNSNNSKMTFLKVGLADDKRKLKNDLQILKLGEVYEGTEEEVVEKLPIKIIYSRIS